MDHFKQYMKSTGMDVQMEYLGDQQLLALQVISFLNIHISTASVCDICCEPYDISLTF